MRVLVVGNSVGCLMRPPRRSRRERIYSEILASQELASGEPIEVTLRCRWSGYLTDIVAQFDDEILCHLPDVVLIHVGVNECTPRTLPRGAWGYLNRKWLPPRGPLSYAVRATNALVRRVTPGVVRLTGGRGWMGVAEFEALLRWLVELVRKETGATPVLLGLARPTDRIERLVPGAQARAAAFDEAIKRVARGQGADACGLVDVALLTEQHGVDRVSPDGIHFSTLGHELVGAQILSELNRLALAGTAHDTGGVSRPNESAAAPTPA